MYAKFGNIQQAQKVFDMSRMLIQILHLSSLSNGIQPDVLTLVSLASSVAQSRDCRSGRSGHGFITRRCWILEDVAGNAVVDMYAKLGIIDSVRRVFEEIPLKDVVSWNTMITGYGRNHSSKYRPIRYVSADTYRKNGVPRRIQADIPLRLKITGVSAESRYVSACKRYTSRYTSRDGPILTGSDRYGKEKVEIPLK
ncbi:hypothetical protein HYC85_000265 [Camellia sinensis]|uniref:Pentatricopeptide repeat-containing protein n=1 Tax=Camellia sinensis TaxID=4442 RepID=A0A7J7I3L8_CAMSI|nr:hypothetical protein HYC85_000265 [Camellia sinensis]